MKANQATYPVRVMGRLLGVSASGFYAWAGRPPSARAVEDIGLTALIHAIHRRSAGAYGAPSIHAELADDHHRRVGKKRVARLMRAARLQGLRAAALRDHDGSAIPPLTGRWIKWIGSSLQRARIVSGWPTSRTSRRGPAFLYLAIVLDVWSRRIVGWAMETHLRTELVLAALDMALTQRRPEAVVHHSDRGCQYTSYAFGKRCRDAGVMPPWAPSAMRMTAMAESFFATLEREVLNRRRFRSQAEARMAIFQWLEGWYTPHRRHSALGYRSPNNYERIQLPQSA